MPRVKQQKQILNFVGGLNTEASPLNFIEGTAKSIDNVDLLRDGSSKRRRGINFEVGGAYSTTTFTEADISTHAVTRHEWISVNGKDDLNFLVIQIGGELFFHKLGEDILSTNIIGKINFDAIKTDTDYKTSPISATSGKGKLFIVSRMISPAYIQYKEDTNTFEGVKITLKIRDIEGINEDPTAPVVFGSEILPTAATDPVDDISDVLNPLTSPFLQFEQLLPPGGSFF